MTESKLRDLITRAVELDREIAERAERLKELKATLVAEARSREEELQEVAGVGSGLKWTGLGNDGCLCRVMFPANRLKSSVDPESKPGQKILELAGSAKANLFIPSVIYRPVDSFRDQARLILGRAAEKLIKACESESTPRVEFETKQQS